MKLALFTGARREEGLQARREHVDLHGGQWWRPRTENGRGRYIALSDEARAPLAAQPSLGTSPWVFPGRFGDKPLNNPRNTFCRVLAEAGRKRVAGKVGAVVTAAVRPAAGDEEDEAARPSGASVTPPTNK